MDTTTIQITKTNRENIEELKQHPRETTDDVLTRLIQHYKKQQP